MAKPMGYCDSSHEQGTHGHAKTGACANWRNRRVGPRVVPATAASPEELPLGSCSAHRGKHAVDTKSTRCVNWLPLEPWPPEHEPMEPLNNEGRMHDGMSEIQTMAAELANVVDEKGKAYGDTITSVAKALELLWPDGVPVKEYGKMLLIARIWDKFGRLANDAEAFGENPWNDVAGYALRGMQQTKRERGECCGQGPFKD
jgi:hypothetical protein